MGTRQNQAICKDCKINKQSLNEYSDDGEKIMESNIVEIIDGFPHRKINIGITGFLEASVISIAIMREGDEVITIDCSPEYVERANKRKAQRKQQIEILVNMKPDCMVITSDYDFPITIFKGKTIDVLANQMKMFNKGKPD